MKFLTNKGFLGIVLLIIIGAICSWLLDGTLLSLSGGLKLLFAIGVTLLPGLLWLWFFYMEDKYEKEPKQMLLGVFALGGLTAYAISKPITTLFVPEVSVFDQNLLSQFLVAFLLVGMIQQLVIFITVRYSIYFSNEFNEPADGVIYSIAAGLGFAAAYNFEYLVQMDAMNLGIVITRIINFYLVMAIFSGIMGYFIGFAKFSKSKNLGREMFMAIGLILAAFLNGLYWTVLTNLQGMEFSILKELAISAGSVIIIYLIMYFLLNRSVEASPFKNVENKPQ